MNNHKRAQMAFMRAHRHIAALDKLDTAELRAEYEWVFNKKPQSKGNLRKKIAYRLRQLAKKTIWAGPGNL